MIVAMDFGLFADTLSDIKTHEAIVLGMVRHESLRNVANLPQQSKHSRNR